MLIVHRCAAKRPLPDGTVFYASSPLTAWQLEVWPDSARGACVASFSFLAGQQTPGTIAADRRLLADWFNTHQGGLLLMASRMSIAEGRFEF